MKNPKETTKFISSEEIMNKTQSEMSRRGFLKTAALAGAAVCVSPALNKIMAGERAIAGTVSPAAGITTV